MALAPTTSSALVYIGVAPQSAIGTPAGAPTVFLPWMRQGTKLMEWMENRREEDYPTGDYYTEQDAPISQPHSQGTLVLPARPTQLAAFLAMCGIVNGAIIPPVPMTVFTGLGPDEEVYSDVFCSGAVFKAPEQGNATWTMQLVGMTEPATGNFRTGNTIPSFEEAYKLYHLRAATLINSTSQVRFSDVTVTYIMETIPQYYSRGDGTPQASDVLLNKLGGFLDFTRAYSDPGERAAFLAACSQTGQIVLPFQQTCAGTSHSLSFTLQTALHAKRAPDAADKKPVGEAFTTRALRGPSGAPTPIVTTYS